MADNLENNVTEGFGTRELTVRAETAVSAVAAQARAAVEARYIVAFQRPRDVDKARLSLLKECRRPGFASMAMYERKVGRKQDDSGRWVDEYAEGLSIRFAETASSLMGNLDAQVMTIYDDREKRIIRASVVDLETNAAWSKDLTIQKTMERKKPKPDQEVLGQRTNSMGEAVYIVEITDDALLQKEAALASKALRTLLLKHIPPDIREECMQTIRQTVNNENAKDPDAARKRVLDSFAYYRVGPDALGEYLGHAFTLATPDELRELIGLYNAIKEKETTWQEALSEKVGPKDPPSRSGNLKDQLKKERAAKKPTESGEREPSFAELPPEPAS